MASTGAFPAQHSAPEDLMTLCRQTIDAVRVELNSLHIAERTELSPEACVITLRIGARSEKLEVQARTDLMDGSARIYLQHGGVTSKQWQLKPQITDPLRCAADIAQAVRAL